MLVSPKKHPLTKDSLLDDIYWYVLYLSPIVRWQRPGFPRSERSIQGTRPGPWWRPPLRHNEGCSVAEEDLSNCCKFLTALARWRAMWVNTCSWNVLPICSACMVFSSPECHFCLWANQSFFFNCFFLTISLDFLDSTATLEALKATKRCPWCNPKGVNVYIDVVEPLSFPMKMIYLLLYFHPIFSTSLQDPIQLIALPTGYHNSPSFR